MSGRVTVSIYLSAYYGMHFVGRSRDCDQNEVNRRRVELNGDNSLPFVQLTIISNIKTGGILCP